MKRDYLRFSAAIGILIYWCFVFYSIARNRWFSFLKDALSDLGVYGATDYHVYNIGLIIAGILFFVFSIYLILKSINKLQVVGGSFVMISSFFISLVGIFVAGTKPHAFIATYFFIQYFLGIAIFGVGSKDKLLQYLCPIIFAFALVLIPAHWPSVALLEVYEISLVTLDSLIIAFRYKRFS